MSRTTLLRIALPIALPIAALFASQSVTAAELRVQVEGLRADTGIVSAGLMASAEAWDGAAAPVAGTGAKIATGQQSVELVFADLAPGRYALRLMHDENGNGELDRNAVGMPTEGYGFSNNPNVMRAATFDEAVFDVPADGTTIQIQMR
jgi:uncharacterized protein (DUF2141 family)